MYFEAIATNESSTAINNITEEELLNNLELLKDILQNFDYDKIKNIVFLDVESFYLFMNQYAQNSSNKTIETIMEEIEPCIPISLCIDSEILDIFLNASVSKNEEDFKRLEMDFYKRARMDFLNTVKNATGEEDWKNIISTCVLIRKAVFG